ncbi:hypothetical protein [Actibacterium mucosum]|uniref:hypothetical protein n=1 Tax=Actibacterium mucosum TaxID=1087332 RepID=UPI00068A67F0|nr:hypothetical protein [Actibacterium mucosum]
MPDSAAGVGFGDYATYQAQRDAQLAGQTTQPDTVQLPENGATQSESPAANTQTAVATPAQAQPVGNPGISDEQDFNAVSSRETIESDAERLARQRSQYQVIEPTALPTRVGGNSGNVVQYALGTSHPVGQALYRRSGLRSNNAYLRKCAGYASDDLAQEAFLLAGGPQRDRMNLDPDGDGYACFWDPAPFRNISR